MSDRAELKKDTRPEVITPEVVSGGDMSDGTQLKGDMTPEVIIPEVIKAAETSEAPLQQKQGWLKGPLGMAICCGAPLLLLLAIPFLGAAFGSLAAVASGLLTVVAVLACPIGMYLMMRMMMKDKK